MRTCGLVTAGECGSRLNAVRKRLRKEKREIDKATDPGAICNRNPSSAAVTLPACNCGSVDSQRLRMINRVTIQTASHNR